MRLLDYFDHVYVINLAERVDRRRSAEQELQKLGASARPGKVTFFPAVKTSDPGGFPSAAVRGCFASHVGVLRAAQAAGHQRVLIAEDDFVWSPRRAFKEQDLVAVLQDADWDLARLGHDLNFPQAQAVSLVLETEDCSQAHFYGVKRRCVEDLVEFLLALLARAPGDPLGGPMHYDGALTTYRMQRPDMRCVLAVPSTASQRRSRSDIHPSYWDRVALLRPAVDIARGILQIRR